MDPLLLALLSADIPSSLRSISPFLSEAQRSLSNAFDPNNPHLSVSRKRVTVYCINHAFKLLNLMEITMDEPTKTALDCFERVRNALASELEIVLDASVIIREPTSRLKIQIVHAEDMMISEADEVMHLAEEQLSEGLRDDAAANFHTATVYYRVLESILPSMAGELHGRLLHAASRTRQCSRLLENYVLEHFDGVTCSDVYEVHGSSKLGKGSYGSVYLATHRMTGDERAVKVMNVDRVTSYYLRKLHTEMAILRKLDHPNIVRLHDVFFGRRSVYLVTELCRGGELFELLTSGKKQGFVFREDRASRLLRDMLSAVKYLHSNGVVHRDLKLENFLFEGESALSPLILIDFGLSKMFDPGEKIRQRVGSCYYTAPEVLNGAYDHRCDLWSLGVITYMLLSGCPPFVGKTPEEIHLSTLSADPEFSERRFRHVSPLGIDFMRRLLIKNPDLRMDTDEALSHPFIQSFCGTPSIPPAPSPSLNPSTPHHQGLTRKLVREIISSLRVYLSASRLTRVVLGLVAHVICAEKIRHLREEFVLLDADHNGMLSSTEIYSALSSVTSGKSSRNSIWKPLTSEEVNSLFASCISVGWNGSVGFSGDHDTLIDETSPNYRELRYHEYIAAAMCRRVDVEEHRIRLAFEMLDTNKRGYLTAECFRSSLGLDVPAEAADTIVAETDRNGHGEVRYNDFIAAWREALMAPRLMKHFMSTSKDENDTDDDVADQMETDNNCDEGGVISATKRMSLDRPGEGAGPAADPEQTSIQNEFAAAMDTDEHPELQQQCRQDATYGITTHTPDTEASDSSDSRTPQTGSGPRAGDASGTPPTASCASIFSWF